MLGLRSLDGDEALAENLTRFLRTFIENRSIDSVSSQTQTLEQMTLISDCPDNVDAACLREIASALSATELIYGFLTRIPGEEGRFTYAVDVRRFSAARRRDLETSGATFESARQGTANLQILVNSMLDELFERRAATSVIVQSNEPGAAVTIDGDVVGTTGAEPLWITDVAPGTHEVRIEKDGFEAWERSVDVAAGEYRLLEAPLAAAETHVAVGPVEPPTNVVPEGDDDDDDSEPGYWSDWHTIAGWSTLGGGVVLAGVGLAFTVSIAGINDDTTFADYRAHTPVGQDACDRAKTDTADADASRVVDLCDSGNTYTILQFVMYGLGLAAVGTGTYFLIAGALDEESPPDEAGTESASPIAGIAVAPFGTPGGGGLSLAAWF